MAKESTSTNGSSIQQQLIAGAMKHGPWAIMATVLAVAFYLFTLKPMADERQTLLEVLQTSVDENRKSMATMAEATAKISDTLYGQQKALAELTAAISEANAHNREIATALKSFSSEMFDVHPKLDKKLDEILDCMKDTKRTP